MKDKKNKADQDSSEVHQKSEVISTGVISSKPELSRRDILKLVASTVGVLAVAPLLGGCADNESQSSATPSPVGPPSEPPVTINAPSVILLNYPGRYDDKVLRNNKEVAVVEGETAYVIGVDETGTWYKVRTNEQSEGWIERKKVSVSPGFEIRMNAVPIVAERDPIPTLKPAATLKPVPTKKPSSPGTILTYWYPN